MAIQIQIFYCVNVWKKKHLMDIFSGERFQFSTFPQNIHFCIDFSLLEKPALAHMMVGPQRKNKPNAFMMMTILKMMSYVTIIRSHWHCKIYINLKIHICYLHNWWLSCSCLCPIHWSQGAVSIRKTVLPGMAIPMLKIRRPNGRLIFSMEIAIRR